MNRTQKARIKKEFIKNYIYPIIICSVVMIILLIIVDYRINSSTGNYEIKIVKIDSQIQNEIKIVFFDKEFFLLNTLYLKRDINNALAHVRCFWAEAKETTTEVIRNIDELFPFHKGNPLQNNNHKIFILLY